LSDTQKTAISSLYYTTHATFQVLEQDISKWGNLREEAGKLQNQINTASLLMGVIENPNEALKLGPRLIATMADRIDLYISMKYPDYKTLAPDELSSKDWGISSVYKANLSSISRWLSFELRKLGEKGN
jgi:hypothetical protein